MLTTRWLSLGIWLVAFGVAGALSAQTVEAEAQTKEKPWYNLTFEPEAEAQEKLWDYATYEGEAAYIGDSFSFDLTGYDSSKLTAAAQDAMRAFLNTKFSTSSLALGGSIRVIIGACNPVAFYLETAFLGAGYSTAGFTGFHISRDLSQFRMLWWAYENLGLAFPIPLSDTLKLIPAFGAGFSAHITSAESLSFIVLGLGLTADVSLFAQVSKRVALTGGLRVLVTPLSWTSFNVSIPRIGKISTKDYVQGGIFAHFGVAFSTWAKVKEIKPQKADS